MALTTSTYSNAESVCNLAQGRVITDAATATAQTFTVGFVPRFVEFVDLTAGTRYEWYEGMANDSAMKTVTAGTYALITSAGVTVNPEQTAGGATPGKSFTIPAAVMIASHTFQWRAQG